MEHYKKVIRLLRGSTESRVQLFDCCALARNNSLYVFNLDQNLVRSYAMKFLPRLSSLAGSYRKKNDLKSEP